MEKNLFKGQLALMLNHLFQTLLLTYLILLLTEQIWTGLVSLYLNLNYLLIIVIIAGILDVFSEHSFMEKKKPNWKDYSFIIILGILGFAIIKFKTSELEWLSWLISIIAGILIVLISLLVLEDDENSENLYMKELKPKPYIITIGIILLLFAISYIITFFAKITFIESLRIIFGSLYVLFLPGFVLSFLFFPKNDESSIDWIERLALSFALSIAIVPLTIFYLNLIGIRINLLNSFLTILLIILLGLVLLYIKGIKKSF